MAIFLQDRQIYPENVTGQVDYLKGNNFQKMTFYCQVRVETWYTLETNRGVLFSDQRFNTNDWLVDRDRGNAFAQFNIGDTIVVDGTTVGVNNRSYVIREKPDDGKIRVYDAFGLPTTVTQNNAQTGRIFLDQESKGITFDFGLPANNEATNFFSKVDGNLMRYEYGTTSPIPSSLTAMSAVGRLSWQIGSGCQVLNATTSADRDNYRYMFEVTQDFYIHPFYKHTEILSLLAGNPPPYYDLSECLKHVFRLRAYRELQDPNVYQEGIFDEKVGNTGWFDEEYNGGNEDWEVNALTYNNSIDTIDRYSVATINFDIDNLSTPDVQYATVNFIMLPEEVSDYQNINSLMQENYCFDRAQNTEGSASVNGDQNGTGYQVIQNFEFTTKGAGVGVAATLDINFGADVLAKIDAYKDKYFLLAVYCVSASQTAELANYTTLLIDVNQIKVEIPDTILTVTNQILFHDQNNNSYVNPSPKIKVEDEIVMDSLVLLDQGTFTDAQINNVSLQLIAKYSTDEAVLLSKDYDFSQLPLSGSVRYINDAQQNSLNVLATEIRKNELAYRNPTQDSGSNFAYRFQYPFMYRWEYWEQLILSTIPADFIDNAEPFNGVNNDWIRLAGLSGWATYYRLAIEVETQNTKKVINKDFLLEDKDYLSNPDWINEDIKIFEGATELVTGGSSYMYNNKDTTVKCLFEYVGGSSIDETDVFMVARIIIKENGTYITSQSYSSVWNRSPISLFTSTNGLITITESAGVFTGEFDIDHSKLPSGVLEFTISASIMQLNVP